MRRLQSNLVVKVDYTLRQSQRQLAVQVTRALGGSKRWQSLPVRESCGPHGTGPAARGDGTWMSLPWVTFCPGTRTLPVSESNAIRSVRASRADALSRTQSSR